VIDLVVHYAIAIVTGLFIGVAIAIAAAGDPVASRAALVHLRETSVLAFVFSIIGSAMYHTVCEALHGSTLGKLICGIVVLDETGQPCGPRAALGRSFAFYVDGLFFGIVGYMAMKGSPLDQRNGDKWFHTIVATRKGVPATALRSGGRFLLALVAAMAADAVFMMIALVAKLKGWG
jgi:uncharacterized RDD family membrane protein YckC